MFSLFHQRFKPVFFRTAHEPVMGVFPQKTEFFTVPYRDFGWLGQDAQFFF
jgi:hypothetical protein